MLHNSNPDAMCDTTIEHALHSGRQRFVILGMSDAPHPYFIPEAVEAIARGRVFSGGLRHREIVHTLLPQGAEWIDITVPLDDVFEQYRAHEEIVVFASGDPLFFGFANTVMNRLPDAEVVVFPAFNSLQMLAHAMRLPYHDMRIVSLTGRPWHEFDRALIERTQKIGLLTDREHTPATIARRMLDYGYTDYTMSVGTQMGNPKEQKLDTLSLREATEREFGRPNCVILTTNNRNMPYRAPMGLSETDFMPLDGRVKMITKKPFRLVSLSCLDLHHASSFWDVGFCTGSVSIEAKLNFPHLHVAAFEIRPEGAALMQENSRRFGAPGIDCRIGDFLDADITDLMPPDAVFIGGHGGKLVEIIAKVHRSMTAGGLLVFNSVSEESRALFLAAIEACGMKLLSSMRLMADANNPIDVLQARKQD